jgi:hypothetical protein
MKVAVLSALSTGPLNTPGDISGTHFCYRQKTKSISLNNGLKQKKQAVGSLPVLPIARQKILLYFIEYVEFFTVLQKFYLFVS